MNAVTEQPEAATQKRRRRPRKRLLFLLAVPAVFYGVFVLVALLFGRAFIFPGASFLHRERIAAPPASVRVLTREIEDGEVYAWLALKPGASAEKPAPLVVFFHGNGELIDDHIGTLDWYRSLGYAAMAVEYRGYGEAAGRPREEAIVGDALDLIGQAVERPDIDGSRVVYHGFSLGGGVAGAVAAQREPQGLVLSSTFSTMGSMFGSMKLPGFVAPDRFDTLGTVRTTVAPVLVTHGVDDPVISFSQGERLGAVDGVSFVSHPGGHNDAFSWPECVAPIESFLVGLREGWEAEDGATDPATGPAEPAEEPAGD